MTLANVTLCLLLVGWFLARGDDLPTRPRRRRVEPVPTGSGGGGRQGTGFVFLVVVSPPRVVGGPVACNNKGHETGRRLPTRPVRFQERS